MKESVLLQPALCKLLCKAESASCFSQLHYWCGLLLPRRLWTCPRSPVRHCLMSTGQGSPPADVFVTFSPAFYASLCTLLSCFHLRSFPTCIHASPLPPPPPPPSRLPPSTPPPLSLKPSCLTNRCSWHHVGGHSSSLRYESRRTLAWNQTRTTAIPLHNLAVSKQGQYA